MGGGTGENPRQLGHQPRPLLKTMLLQPFCLKRWLARASELLYPALGVVMVMGPAPNKKVSGVLEEIGI